MVILAAAGSRKTEYIIDSALKRTTGRALILTFTSENQRHIARRIEAKAGMVPSHIAVMGWFSFLITQCAKPYQRALTGEPFALRGLNFIGERHKFAKKSQLSYFVDSRGDLYRDGVADFVVQLNKKTAGAVAARLGRVYSHVYVDEIQDLVGYDLDVLELLLQSGVEAVLVGDPRQHTYSTNLNPRNKKYQGAGLTQWFKERSSICSLEERCVSYRCNQKICDFADALFPEMPPTKSIGVPEQDHHGIIYVPYSKAQKYFSTFGDVTALRYNRKSKTAGIQAINIGLAKGRTFDRVMLFPAKTMLNYLLDDSPMKPGTRAKLYVAATRARFSVAIVVPDLVAKKIDSSSSQISLF